MWKLFISFLVLYLLSFNTQNVQLQNNNVISFDPKTQCHINELPVFDKAVLNHQEDNLDDLHYKSISVKETLKFLNKTKDNNFVYNAEIDKVKTLNKKFYSKAVKNLPIVCVDVFLVNENTQEYFLLKRKNEPAKDAFWVPGGRLFKGESFFECAKRKCFEEMNIIVDPQFIVDVYSTTFINSAFDVPTHTINIAIFATCNDTQVNLDNLHSDYKWVSVHSTSDNEYVEAMRSKVMDKVDFPI